MQSTSHDSGEREKILSQVRDTLAAFQSSIERGGARVIERHLAGISSPLERERTIARFTRYGGRFYRAMLDFQTERHGHAIVAEAHRSLRT